jgi:hypothetical protein
MAELEDAARKERTAAIAEMSRNLRLDIVSNEDLLSKFEEVVKYLRDDQVEYEVVSNEFYRRLYACGYM